MNPMLRSMSRAALILAAFALFGSGLVAVMYAATKDTIAREQRAALEATLNQLLPAGRYDNQITEDRIYVTDREWLGSDDAVTFYRARKGGEAVALFASLVAPDGYSGPIQLLVGVAADGTLLGVRVLAHKETPGLGDAIEARRTPWILGFSGKSLGNPALEQWKVKKDGGVFDQFTGATITPRAVVNATRRFLQYVETHREELFK